MKEDYAVGDEVWIYAGEYGPNGEQTLSKGKVVDALALQLRALIQYVILLDDPDFFHLEIRDPYLMTDDPEKPPRFAQMRYPRKSTVKPAVSPIS